MYPLVVLQSICTTWTKASRGGAEAAARNGLPDVQPLPVLALPLVEDQFLFHEVVYTERDHFQHPMEQFEVRKHTNPFWYNCLQLSLDRTILSVTLEWERSKGVPRRSLFPRVVWNLQPNQWGRLIYNLRYAGEDHWAYQKYVISIGFFPIYSPRLFLETEATHIYRDIAQLW